jgi:hypothetical protein
LSKKAKYWYLGITFDRKLVWNEHINNVANKTLARISALYPLLGCHSNLSPVLKLCNYTWHADQPSVRVAQLGPAHTNRNPKTPHEAEQMLKNDSKIFVETKFKTLTYRFLNS